MILDMDVDVLDILDLGEYCTTSITFLGTKLDICLEDVLFGIANLMGK